ncbi:hypothetical protein BKA82DRAFT_4186241 [Pisolithus tinctorius]|nr:hypothetical protein BKA82DRAFT_4186241 [Pisolithus tinctorius]
MGPLGARRPQGLHGVGCPGSPVETDIQRRHPIPVQTLLVLTTLSLAHLGTIASTLLLVDLFLVHATESCVIHFTAFLYPLSPFVRSEEAAKLIATTIPRTTASRQIPLPASHVPPRPSSQEHVADGQGKRKRFLLHRHPLVVGARRQRGQ